jgi:Fe-S-cluster containining protein
MNTGLPSEPQKSPALGPDFDFLSPAVQDAEAALRIVARNMKEELEVLLAEFEPGPGYARLQANLAEMMPILYRHYDGFVAAVLATGPERIACSKGCSHCCSHYVTSVEPYELLFLHGRVRETAEYPSRVIGMHRRAALFSSLRDGRQDEEAEDRALYRYYLRNQPCPFLGEGGKCGVYESRPISCRMFFSLSHPSLCKGKSVIAPGNRNFLIELPEDIEADLARAGALFARFSLPESLFEGLLKVNEIFGQFDVTVT